MLYFIFNIVLSAIMSQLNYDSFLPSSGVGLSNWNFFKHSENVKHLILAC
jgi:hypothetical protein